MFILCICKVSAHLLSLLLRNPKVSFFSSSVDSVHTYSLNYIGILEVQDIPIGTLGVCYVIHIQLSRML